MIHLPDARFGHGQNFAADLRLMGSEVAVRRIELLFARPPDYRPGGIDPAMLAKVCTRIGPGMELDIGCDVDRGEAALFRVLGVTSIESYVTWQTVEDAGQGKWDWSRWDRQVEILRGAGLKWAPLVVVGPAYATPKWYRESARSVPYVCLEHGIPSKIQSLWNPQLRPWVDRFIQAFAERYRDQGIIELVRLGVTGIYGETLYPSGPVDGPIFAIPGLFHNHGGWWAGDPLAAASFRDDLRRRYADPAALNRAWAAHYDSFDAVVPLLPEKLPSPRARLDFVDWYLQSMTDFTAFWAATVRKYFPATPIYMSLGGAGEPQYGADFSAQARAIAPYHTRIRVTNEGSHYDQNFVVTREVVSACRAFGLECGFEPAGHVSAEGNVARIYNATASGGIHLFCYKGNILQNSASLAAFRRYAPLLTRRTPLVDAALYLPKTSWILDGGCQSRVFAAARDLRGRLDFEMLDRTTFATPLAADQGVGDSRRALRRDGRDREPAALGRRRRNPRCRGIVRAAAAAHSGRRRRAVPDTAGRRARRRTPVSAALQGPPPRRFRLELGSAHDEHTCGASGTPWSMAACSPESSRRNALDGGPGRLLPPLRRGGRRHAAVDREPHAALAAGPNRVLVGGVEVGRIEASGVRTYRFAVPRRLLRRATLRKSRSRSATCRPRHFGNPDNRELGVAVAAVELFRPRCRARPALPPRRWPGDRLAQARPAHAAADRPRPTLAMACQSQGVQRGGRAGPGPSRSLVGSAAAPSRTVITAGDGLYATRLSDGILYYNAGPKSQKTASRFRPTGSPGGLGEIERGITSEYM